jgi:deazaflavin-dependent oxidoreductase (nitroreductase family)
MPKNRPKPKKIAKKNLKRTKKAPRKAIVVRSARPVKDTYDEWLSKQVRSRSGRQEARSETARPENPRDTFNEWLKKQHVKESAPEQKISNEIPRDTYEIWMARQIRQRNKSEETVEASGGSSQLLSLSQKNKDISTELSSTEEIQITVTGRKTGKSHSAPVWFVYDEGNQQFSLLPLRGSHTNWFKNLQAKPMLGVGFGDKTFTVDALTKVDTGEAEEVAKKFRTKYGEEEVSKYYPTIDAFVRFSLK